MAVISVVSPFQLIRFVHILLILSRLNALSHRKLETANPLNVSHFLNFHPNATPHQGEGHGLPLFSTSKSTATGWSSFLMTALTRTMRSQANANLSASKAAATASVPFHYSDTLMVEVLVGTPPQKQRMVLDTGSELSWLYCAHKDSNPPPFDPTLSPSYNTVPCNSSVCSEKTIDFPVPTSCDAKSLCYFTYTYADGTDVEGNLGSDVVTLQPSNPTAAPLRIPGVVLGCASSALPDTPGLMGLNRGALSFVSQLQTLDIASKFSYCIADRFLSADSPGVLYFGNSPFANFLHYTQLFTIALPLPYFNRAAYSVKLEGIKVGSKLLPIPKSVFLPDHTGAGQTMIDSGTQFTFILGDAYTPLKQEFIQQNRRLLKNPMGGDFVFQGAMDLCYQQPANAPFPQMLSPVTLLFESAEITLNGHQLLYQIPESSAGNNVANGCVIYCFTFGNSDLVPVEANIIGNHQQQNLWIEYDLQNSRIGFARASCNIN
jgi:hypothetical protein